MKDGKITLYDNAANRARPNVHSRGLVLRLDKKRLLGKPKAQIVGEFTATPPVLGGTQGNVQTLPDGGVMVGWGGGIPRFTEFDDQGTTTFEARFLTPGTETYRAYRTPWNATPQRGPTSRSRTPGNAGRSMSAGTGPLPWQAGGFSPATPRAGCAPGAPSLAQASTRPSRCRQDPGMSPPKPSMPAAASSEPRARFARPENPATGLLVRQQVCPRLVSDTVPAWALPARLIGAVPSGSTGPLAARCHRSSRGASGARSAGSSR